MIESLMPWYERELHTLWKECQLFSKNHPQLAKYLSFSHGRVDDPHAARTMEAFALLNARLSRQLATDSNKMTVALLQLLFPVSMQSLPSVSIIRIPPTKKQSGFGTLPKNTRFWVYNDDQRYCQFHTTRNIDLCPFDIVSCHMEQRPFNQNDMDYSSSDKMLLNLKITMMDDTLTFSDCGDFSTLTVQLSGLFRLQILLYDILNKDLSGIILSTPEGGHLSLPVTCFSPVGFDDECIMRTNPSHLLDHQKMFELFAWPELFFGFELKEIGRWLKHCQSNRVTLTFCLSSHCDELMQNIGLVQFLLGCAPIINVFEHIAEPITIDHKQLNYPVIPDVASNNTMEVQDIVDIVDITRTEPETLPNLFGLCHNEKGNNKFWVYRPSDNESEEFGHLEIIYTELDPYSRQVMVLSPHVLCNNGNQVLDLPDNPKLECIDSVTIPDPDKVSLLLKPTATVKRSGDIKAWLNLFAYLHNSILTILESSEPVRQLRHVINLYTIRNHAASNAWLSSIQNMTVKNQVATLKINGQRCFTQGSEIIFELDPAQLANTSTMMFTNLLDYIAAHFVGFNSYIQVVIKLKGSEEEYIRCTRHHGYQMNR